MSDPQFPDPMGKRRQIRPGATQHTAGLDPLRRIDAIERGAANRKTAPESLLTTRGDLIRRGASAPERVALGATGLVLTSNGTDAVWSRNGQQVSGGRVVYTSGYASASLAAGANSTDMCTALSVTGDNVNGMMIELSGFGAYPSTGTWPAHFEIRIWDGAIGGAKIGAGQFYVSAVNTSGGGYYVRGYLAPFSGSKTIRASLYNGSAAAAVLNDQSTAAPTIFSATWVLP